MTAGTCWQYKIKKSLQEQNPIVPIEMPVEDISILPIEWKIAKEFILKYEWIGNMGNSKYCFGLFIRGRLACVVCYGPLVAPFRYNRLLGEDLSRSILQLCRGASAFWAPIWASSKLVSATLRLIKKTKNIKIVVAYADPDAGEIGTIYQACNAYYIGMTSPGGGKKYIINGHMFDPRKVVSKFGSRSSEYLQTIDPKYTTIPIKPKHRYLFILENNKKRKETLELITPWIKAYPKRFIPT